MRNILLKVFLSFMVLGYFSSALAEEKKSYSINFKNVPVIEYINFVSKVCSVNFLYDDTELNFNVTVVSDEEVAPANTMASLLQILRIHGLTLLQDDKNLVIHKNPEVKQLAKIVTDKTSLDDAPPVVTKVFRIRNTKVDSLAGILKPMISTEALLEVSYETRQIIISDITANIKKISDLVDIIDSPQNPLEIEIYKAKVIQPSFLIDMTNQIITPLTEGTPFILVPQDANGLLYLISTPKLIEKAISILASLDVATKKSEIKKNLKPSNIFVYKLSYQPGSVIEIFIHEMIESLKQAGYGETGLLEILQSSKYLKETNSFLFTGSAEAISKMQEIMSKVDVPPTGLEGQKINFFIYKPMNRPVTEIASAVLELSESLAKSKLADPALIEALKTVKIVEATNSLLFTGENLTFSSIKELLTSIDLTGGAGSLGKVTFFLYKIQNAPADQIIAALYNTAENLKKADVPEKAFLKAIDSVKHIEDSNSLLFTGDSASLKQIQELLPTFDTDLKYKKTSQFFIYKPKYKSAEDIMDSLKEISSNLQSANLVSSSFMKTIENMKEVTSSQSVLFAGDDSAIKRIQELLANIDAPYVGEKETYFLYKLQNTPGNIIEEDLDSFAEKLKNQKIKNPELIKTIVNAKWIKETNSIMLTGSPKALEEARQLIEKYDIAKRGETSHTNFYIYKPKYAAPSYIENSLRDTVSNLKKAQLADPDLITAIDNLKIIDSTQSLAFTGAEKTIEKIKSLINDIDIPSAAAHPLRPGTSYLLYKVLKASPTKLLSSVRAMTTDLKKSGTSDKELLDALDSMKFQSETNSILITGSPTAIEKVRSILEKFDSSELVDDRSLEGPSGYFVYKPKNLTGPSIENVLQNFVDHLKRTGFENPGLFQVIQNMNWDEATNTLVFSGNEKAISEIKTLLDTFDIPGKDPSPGTSIIPSEDTSFLVYKLQYHKGDEIQNALKQISKEFETSKSNVKKNLLSAINSIQWIQVTNSLLTSGDRESMAKIKDLISSLDVPLKQVFIEMLVIETSFSNLLNFGLDWASKFKYRQKFVAGTSSTNALDPTASQDNFMQSMAKISESTKPTGAAFPFEKGFDLGVIGDVLLHKGSSFLSLGSFIKALQTDDESTVVMTPKILTQDGKQSSIFIGQNIPYIGSQSTLTGAVNNQTQNLEYRDVGLNLTITPVLGNTETVTLDINLDRSIAQPNSQTSQVLVGVTGIVTSKTTMQTTVHMPNKSFLVLSGMVTETKTKRKSGIPCLGGLPLIGAAFSESDTVDSRRNIVIFIRPHIINSYQDMQNVSENQEDFFREKTGSPNMEEDFEDSVESIKSSDDE